MRYPKPNEGQLMHRYGRLALKTLESLTYKQARTVSPAQTIHDAEVDNNTMNLKTKEDIATELV